MINARQLTRRGTLLLAVAGVSSSFTREVEAEEESDRHGMSAFGDLKYPPDFKHFDYVNPNAPKGGIFSLLGRPGPSIKTFSPSIRSTASSSRATARRAWS